MKTEVYTLPAYWASALINDDTSGLAETEKKGLNAWLDYAKPGSCINCSGESFFTRWHDAYGYALACECREFTFQVVS